MAWIIRKASCGTEGTCCYVFWKGDNSWTTDENEMVTFTTRRNAEVAARWLSEGEIVEKDDI